MDPNVTTEPEQNEQTNQAPINEPVVKKSFLNRKKIVFFTVGLIFVALLVFLLSLFTRQSVDTQANLPPPEPENVLLATVGDNQIYYDDIVNVALEQYLKSAINKEVLGISLDIAVERAILDNEAKTLGIVIQPNDNKIEYYEALKSAIMAREIGTVTANTISFWVPAFNDIYPQTEEYQQMRDLQPEVFAEATRLLQSGENAYDIGKLILEKYPVYTPKLAVNSYILSKMTDASLMQSPVTYEYLVNDSNKLLLDFMFNMTPGQINTLVWPEGEGAALVQVVSKNSGDKISYQQWLDEKEQGVIFEENNINSL